jgi:threonylcarbamoyladenosine tRNA methylthiotransferase MtaB
VSGRLDAERMGVPHRVHLATFGCRVNQADSDGLRAALLSRGLALVDEHHSADVVVINSCTVTHRSDTDLRKLVARVHRDNPSARVVVAGCAAQRDPGAALAWPGTSAVVGHSDAFALADVVLQLGDGARPDVPWQRHAPLEALPREALPPVRPAATIHARTRPFVKIQDGCDARCTYCVIPSVRGAARSAPPDEVVASVRSLAEQGAQEVVLTGVHLGTYGRHHGTSLEALVRRILDEVPRLARLRLSAIEPMAFPPALVTVAAEDHRLAPHFHLPLQSGSDRVLRRMSRPYRRRDFEALVQHIHHTLPHACVGTDVIVGFPGETAADFAETLSTVERAGLDHVHVFSYSDRPGVPSTRLPDKVDSATIKARAAELSAVSEGRWARFLDQFVGRTVEALTLARDPARPEGIDALTPSYVPVRVADPTLAPNTRVRVELLERDGEHLVGVPAAV